MDTNVNYTIVGMFVISMVAAMTLAIIWLSSGFSMEQYKTYTVYMQESVSGLSIDAPVEFNGVNVGSVKSVDIDPHNPRLVKVELDVKSETPVTVGTLATLTTKGITGITYIALKDKGDNMQPLKVLDGQRYPVITTAPSLFVKLDQTINQLTENIHRVTNDLDALLNKENLESIRAILNNMERVTGTMAANGKQINTILHNAATLSERLNPLIQSSTNTVRILEVQTLPLTYRLLNNLDSASRSLAEVSSEIKQNPAVLIRGINRNNYGPGER